MMSSRDYGKMSPEQRKELSALAAMRGRDAWGNKFIEDNMGLGYDQAQARAPLSALRAGFDSANIGRTYDRAQPKYDEQALNLGDRVQYFQRNPYQPGIVSNTMQSFKTGASPANVMQNKQFYDKLAQDKATDMARIGATIQAARINAGASRQPMMFEAPDGSGTMLVDYSGRTIGTVPGRPTSARYGLGGNGGTNRLGALKAIQENLMAQMEDSVMDDAQTANMRNQLAQVNNMMAELGGFGGQPSAPELSPAEQAIYNNMVLQGGDPEQSMQTIINKRTKK